MPNKVTIQVQVGDTRPWRPVRSLGLLLMELRTRIGLGHSAKFRPTLAPPELHEVKPSPSKRVRG